MFVVEVFAELPVSKEKAVGLRIEKCFTFILVLGEGGLVRAAKGEISLGLSLILLLLVVLAVEVVAALVLYFLEDLGIKVMH